MAITGSVGTVKARSYIWRDPDFSRIFGKLRLTGRLGEVVAHGGSLQ
jgi:hypothetical protein